MKNILTAFFLTFWFLNGFAQKENFVKPLGSFSLQSDNTWLKSAFDNQIKPNVKLLGLGEITHGSTEVFQFKAKTIQYLVEEKGFRQVLFEYPDAALFLLKRYLLDDNYEDKGILKYMVNQSFGNAIRDASYREMFQWIKDYNQSHPNDKISIAGFDIVGAAPSFINYFKTKFSLEPAAAVKLDTANWKRMPVRAIANRLLNHVHNVESQLKRTLGKEWTEFSYLVDNAELELEHDDMNRQNIYAAAKFRDSVMTENILQLDSKKSIIWAHNLHCTTADMAVSMGNFIKKKIGDEYYIVLTDFSDKADVSLLNRTGIQTISLKADKRTAANQLLRKQSIADGISFYPDLISNRIEPNVGFIDRNGKYYFTGKGKAFDALVVFEELSPVR